jgi:hypothetical protein
MAYYLAWAGYSAVWMDDSLQYTAGKRNRYKWTCYSVGGYTLSWAAQIQLLTPEPQREERLFRPHKIDRN